MLWDFVYTIMWQDSRPHRWMKNSFAVFKKARIRASFIYILLSQFEIFPLDLGIITHVFILSA